MRYVPVKPGDAAGLVAFHNEEHYFFLRLTLDRGGGETVVQLEQRSGPNPSDHAIVASKPVRLASDAPIYLKVEARGKHYDFSYAVAPNQWQMLIANVDGTNLSSKVAGGFVGTYFGMHAYSPEK
jgi:alpha-N-arabinofuranosidase